MLFEELTDPPGIRFWPEYKGRDGCRTPIPWEEGEPPNGFTTGKPWLPVKSAHAALNVAAEQVDPESMLAFYRRLIAWRKGRDCLVEGGIGFLKTAEPVLAYRRTGEGASMLCAFNLSPEALTLAVAGLAPDAAPDPISERAVLEGRRLTLGPNGFAFIPDGGQGTIRYTRPRAKAKAD
jgi:alpha-glucosidase